MSSLLLYIPSMADSPDLIENNEGANTSDGLDQWNMPCESVMSAL